MFSLGNAAATAVTSEFDWFTLTTPGGGSGGAGDEFTGTSLDKTRWNAIAREDTSLYTVGNGGLTTTLVQVRRRRRGNRNYFLQTADHTSPDYVLETKLSAWTFVGQLPPGRHPDLQDDNNYVKFNAISDGTNTRINRMEIRSKVGGTVHGRRPEPQRARGRDGDLAAADEVGHELPGRGVVQRHHLADRRRADGQPDART